MNEIHLFQSQGDLERWLETQNRTAHQKLVVLNSLRVLPLVLPSSGHVSAISQQGLTDAEIQPNDQFVLASFRAALCAFVAAWSDQEKYRKTAQTAREHLRNTQKLKNAQVSKANRTATALRYAASVASPDILSADRSTRFTAYSIWTGWTLLRDVSSPSERTEWRSDPELQFDIKHNAPLKASNNIKLFNKTTCPETISAAWKEFKAEAELSQSPWGFWSEWYQGFLSGNPMDLSLQKRVALIDEEVWSLGPDAVARAVGQMQARHDVKLALSVISESVTNTEFDRFGIGGNHPPEDISDQEFVHSLNLIWDTVRKIPRVRIHNQ